MEESGNPLHELLNPNAALGSEPGHTNGSGQGVTMTPDPCQHPYPSRIIKDLGKIVLTAHSL
jgi:hypothetical protein